MSKTIKFNAGKVSYDSDTKRCTPLPHKGTVTISPSQDDEGFYDFVWAPKSDSGLEKDELLVIPGDLNFTPVSSCKTGRVVALTFLSSGDKSLYWLQDVGDDEVLDRWTDKDKALVTSVQALFAADDDDANAEAEPESVPASAVDQDSRAHAPGVSSQAAESVASSAGLSAYPVSSLGDVLSGPVVSKYLSSLSTEELQSRYGDMLPEGVEPTHEAIMDVVNSEFFRSANDELSMNITENGVGHILASSYGYGYNGEGIEAFLNGLRQLSKDG